MGSSVSDSIQIKTLPRSNEAAGQKAVPQPPAPGSREGRWLALFGIASLAFSIGLIGVWWHSRTQWINEQSRQIANTAEHDPVAATINRHMYNTHLKEEMMKRKLMIENQQMLAQRKTQNQYVLPEINPSYGVQMDQENSAEKVYQDLTGNSQSIRGVNIEEKVNTLLANRKWMNELERAERLTFVRNFIREAYNRGWEVQLDQNLVVTGVRRITTPQQVNIEQVLNRLAQKGE